MMLNANGNLVINGSETNALRLVGPVGPYGYGARLNFGDANYAYIEEDIDDSLKIYGDRIMLSGNVGIGTATPAVALDVVGAARAGVYQFTAPKQHVLTIGAAAFHLGDSVHTDYTTERHNPETVAGATSIPGIPGPMVAPVSLPHGAVVTQVTFWLYNNASLSGPWVSFCRVRHDQTDTNSIAFAAAGIASGIASHTDTPVLYTTVDSLNYQYYLKTEYSASDNGVRAVVIRYTTTEAE